MSQKDRFIEMIQEHEGIIYKVSSLYAKSKEDQRDLVQEILLQMWKAWKSFRQESKLSTWMYRIAMNTAITHLRKGKKRGEKVEIDRIVLDLCEQKNPELEARLNLLYRHIEALDKLDKGIILLYLEDRSYEEISEITGLSQSNVGTRLSRIKKKLKSTMLKQS